jgi:hypothetical protein
MTAPPEASVVAALTYDPPRPFGIQRRAENLIAAARLMVRVPP